MVARAAGGLVQNGINDLGNTGRLKFGTGASLKRNNDDQLAARTDTDSGFGDLLAAALIADEFRAISGGTAEIYARSNVDTLVQVAALTRSATPTLDLILARLQHGAYSQFQVPPAFDALQTVPATAGLRIAWCRVLVSGAAAADGAVFLEVETGVGTGVYQIVDEFRVPTGTVTSFASSVRGVIQTGRRYKFTKTGNAGVTEALQANGYNYVDL